MKNTNIRQALVLGLLATIWIPSTWAAAFCITGQGRPPECIYDDVEVCHQAASPPNSFCSANPLTTWIRTGTQAYCVAHSNLIAECLYTDRAQCERVASGAKAACLVLTPVETKPGTQPLDPFLQDPRRP